MKGVYKGVKYSLSQMFVVKEPELEIGGPTDVKHVAHIGWDGPSGGNPSWMNTYETGPDFATTSVGNPASGISARPPSKDCGESTQQQSESETRRRSKGIPQSEIPPTKTKPRRKKCKQGSCPTSESGGSTRPSRLAKSKPKFSQDNAEPNNIQVT